MVRRLAVSWIVSFEIAQRRYGRARISPADVFGRSSHACGDRMISLDRRRGRV
jgi:hypothetical protein